MSTGTPVPPVLPTAEYLPFSPVRPPLPAPATGKNGYPHPVVLRQPAAPPTDDSEYLAMGPGIINPSIGPPAVDDSEYLPMGSVIPANPDPADEYMMMDDLSADTDGVEEEEEDMYMDPSLHTIQPRPPPPPLSPRPSHSIPPRGAATSTPSLGRSNPPPTARDTQKPPPIREILPPPARDILPPPPTRDILPPPARDIIPSRVAPPPPRSSLKEPHQQRHKNSPPRDVPPAVSGKPPPPPPVYSIPKADHSTPFLPPRNAPPQPPSAHGKWSLVIVLPLRVDIAHGG
eukprot:sb/3467706/